MSDARIVITGLGVFSPTGNNLDTFYDNLNCGKTNINQLNLDYWQIDHPKFYINEIDEAIIQNYLQKHFLKKIDPSIAYSLIASEQAIADAGLKESILELNEKIGISFGSTFAGMEFAEKEYLNYVNSLKDDSPFKISAYLSISMFQCGPAGQVAIKNNIKGKIYSMPNGNTSAIDNIFNSCCQLKHNDVDIMLAGTTEAPFTPFCISSLYSSGILKEYSSNNFCCTPFTKNNKGFLLSEGSAVFSLERIEDAIQRNSKIYAEVLACFNTINPSIEKAGKNCISKLFKLSDINPDDIDLIMSYGVGSLNDEAEINILIDIFGKSLKNIPITTIKPITGHSLSSSSGYDILAAIWCLNNNKVIPFPSNGEELIHSNDVWYANDWVEKEIKIALVYSIDFNGKFSAIILKKIENE